MDIYPSADSVFMQIPFFWPWTMDSTLSSMIYKQVPFNWSLDS